MQSEKLRVAVIFHRLGPYHSARLEAAARDCDVTTIELGSKTREYAWSQVESTASYTRVTLFPGKDSRTMPVREIAERMRDVLRDCKPAAVAIPGWSDKGALAALRWCLEDDVPSVLMSESTAQDERRVWWKELVKRRIVKLYSSALVGGQRHVDYLVTLGMPRERVFTGYDAVDNRYFRQKAEVVRGQKSEIRQKYRLPKNYFLASARFIEKKNLRTLIHAYHNYRKDAGEDAWHLVLLGDGPLKSDLCRLISDLGLHDFVILPGFKQYDELPVFYALASAFVHASRSEPWGLVVNEAIASGLPVIVSNRCGCVPELVGDNGFTFDPSDEHELASRLFEMASLSDDAHAGLQSASLRIAANFCPKRFGEGLKRAAQLAVGLGPKRPGLFHHALLRALLRR